jgi:uncharacterized protein YjiS (DUF1127 family)
MSILVATENGQTVRSLRKTAIQDAIAALISAYFRWQERRQQRLLLARLDDRMLKDIGLTRSDVDGSRF